jgi:hypothetical protein
MPLEKRLELNAKTMDDYHRKKLERQAKETVDAPSNKNIQGLVLGETVNLNTLDTFLSRLIPHLVFLPSYNLLYFYEHVRPNACAQVRA